MARTTIFGLVFHHHPSPPRRIPRRRRAEGNGALLWSAYGLVRFSPEAAGSGLPEVKCILRASVFGREMVDWDGEQSENCYYYWEKLPFSMGTWWFDPKIVVLTIENCGFTHGFTHGKYGGLTIKNDDSSRENGGKMVG